MFLLKKSKIRFAVVAIYLNDLNLIGTPEELLKTVSCLKNELEIKDLRKIKFCLDL